VASPAALVALDAEHIEFADQVAEGEAAIAGHGLGLQNQRGSHKKISIDAPPLQSKAIDRL
jgi:hypothetical protein